jgi:GNAT superfamily N-acetyltransferase
VHPAELAERNAWRSLGPVPGISVLEIGRAACVAFPALPESPMVNHTVGVGEDEPAGEGMLDAIDEFYAGMSYYLALTPRSSPQDVRSRLARRGFTRGYDWMKFTRPTTDIPPARTALEVHQIGSEAGSDFADVVVAGYELPPAVLPTLAAVPTAAGCYAYVAYAEGEPAAAGAIFVSDEVAWLGFAATKPTHRRKGGQGAILSARLARARELGVETVVTETGVMEANRPSNSYRNILRSGFTEAYVRENYLSPARAMAAS